MLQDANLIYEIKNLIATARETAIRTFDFQRTLLYWHIGERIFNEEQRGKERADYGTYLTKLLAKELVPLFGSGFFSAAIGTYAPVLQDFSNCELTAFTIELGSLSCTASH